MNMIYVMLNKLMNKVSRKNLSPRSRATFYTLMSKVFGFLGKMTPKRR